MDKIGRARPTTWAKYATASFTVKILRDTLPRRLHDHLRGPLYYERRQDGILKFYDNSKSKVGAQAIGNRLGYIFSEIKTPIRLNESDDQLHLTLKKCLKVSTAIPLSFTGHKLSNDCEDLQTLNPTSR